MGPEEGMAEFHFTIDALEAEIREGRSLMLIEPIRDEKYNLLIGTEKVLTEKDILKIREKTKPGVNHTFRVRTVIPHYIDEEKRIKWAAYIISLFQGNDLFENLSRERKDFVTKYLKSILSENDYIIWKLSQVKAFSKKVFDHSVNTCFTAMITYFTYLNTRLSGMMDPVVIEKVITVSLLHNVGIMKYDPKIFEKKRMEIAPNRNSWFYQHPIEAFKMIKAEGDKHEMPDDVMEAILDSEEFLDGTGGPRGIQGDDLTFLARLVSLCGYFELLLSEEFSHKARHYREYIAKLRGDKSKFDPELLEALDLTFKYLFQAENP
jgi:HD-GYP domain-containing protein (c-di-GMP phosphodiesterase class II)